MDNIVVFHTGRGGRFNNQGFVTCKGIVGEFSAEYFGVNIFFDEENGIVTDDSGNEVCTIEEYNSDSGTLDLDGVYNTYRWLPFKDLDAKQTEIMIRDLRPSEYKNLLLEDGFSEKLFNFLIPTDDLLNHAFDIHSRITIDDFLITSDVMVYNSEDEAQEDGFFDYLEHNGSFYVNE